MHRVAGLLQPCASVRLAAAAMCTTRARLPAVRCREGARAGALGEGGSSQWTARALSDAGRPSAQATNLHVVSLPDTHGERGWAALADALRLNPRCTAAMSVYASGFVADGEITGSAGHACRVEAVENAHVKPACPAGGGRGVSPVAGSRAGRVPGARAPSTVHHGQGFCLACQSIQAVCMDAAVTLGARACSGHGPGYRGELVTYNPRISRLQVNCRARACPS